MSAANEAGSGPRTFLIVAASTALALWVVYEFSGVFGPLFAAFGIAYALEPVIAALVRRRVNRRLAVGIVFFATIGLLVASGWLISVQGAAMMKDVLAGNGGEAGFQRGIQNWTRMTNEFLRELDLGHRAQDPDFWKPIAQPVATALKNVLTNVLDWLGLLGVLVLTPVYALYLMVDLPDIAKLMRDHLPRRDRERTDRVLQRIHTGLSAFVRGRLLIAILKGLVIALGLWIVGAPYAFLLGMLAGAVSILPIVGPLLGWLVAAGVDLANETTWTALLLVTAVFIVAEAIENFILLPRVMKQGVDLHPLTVLFCVVFWGAVGGAFGALLAIPLTLCVKILHEEYLLPEIRTLAK